MNIITKLEYGKRNKNRVNVYIDDEFAFSVDAEIIYKEGLKIKDAIDINRLNGIVEEDNYIKCKNAAIRIIEKSYKSEKEIHDKLLQKEFDHKTISRTLCFLKEYNLLDDKKLASMYIKDKIKNQGSKKIKYLLMQKGINEEIINEELNNIESEQIEDTAYNLAIKKYNVLIKRESDKYKLYQKLSYYLCSRGYDYDLVSKTVKRILNKE